MRGPLLTTMTPEAAPGELFAGDAPYAKSEQLPSDLRGFFRRWRHSDLHFEKLTTRRQPVAISTRASFGGPR
jgi:hypothetical protein